MDLQAALELLQSLPPQWAYIVLFSAAMIEYVFPPFPGDTVVVAGTALVTAFGWPLVPVFACVTAGAMVGGGVDFAVGAWMLRSGAVDRMPPGRRKIVDSLVSRFERYGSVYLAINRFLPGVRALFFIAAGLAGMRTLPVLAWALVSALAWNGLLMGVGYQLGGNLDEMALWMSRHAVVVGVFMVAAALVLGWQVWRED